MLRGKTLSPLTLLGRKSKVLSVSWSQILKETDKLHKMDIQFHLHSPPSYVSLLRAIKGLDDAIAVLEKQFEAVEETKANVLDLKEGSVDDTMKAQFFGSV